ncbi:MAG: VOC family protein [Anaerolineae bacterium]|nr:VOC family protein [Anaerolineae bacterium]
MFKRVNATVLFVQDLDKCLRFYRDTLGFAHTFSDDVSHAFRLDDQDFVVLTVDAAAAMITPEAVGVSATGGHRVLLCAGVDDVDAVYQALTAQGIAFIKPPQDQAWGRRTAYFADPEGNLWELYQMLEG